MNLILEWNYILLEAIRNVGKLPPTSPDLSRGGPPQVARSIGVVYTAVYDAWSEVGFISTKAFKSLPRKSICIRNCHFF